MQMHDASAAGIADQSDETARRKGLADVHSRRRTLEMTEQHKIVPLLSALSQDVMGHYRVAEEWTDVQDDGVPLLLFQSDQPHLGATLLHDVDTSVADRRECRPSSLERVRHVEIIAAHDLFSIGHLYGKRVALVLRRAIGSTRYLVVQAP